MKFIAIAGKGGTGKTTFASLIIRNLQLKNIKPILAIDADPNSNLGEILGLKYHETIADICEKILEKKDNFPGGMSKPQYIEYQINKVIVENTIDLLVMGKPEGPTCYCYINNLLREYLNIITRQYIYVIIDNEAGMEHLSRRLTFNIDILFIVAENTLPSFKSASRIHKLAIDLNLKIKNIYLVINKTEKSEILNTDLKIIGTIPFDVDIKNFEENNKSLLSLPETSIALNAISKIMNKINEV